MNAKILAALALLTTAIALVPAAAADTTLAYECVPHLFIENDFCTRVTEVPGPAVCAGETRDGAYLLVVCGAGPGCPAYVDLVGVVKACA